MKKILLICMMAMLFAGLSACASSKKAVQEEKMDAAEKATQISSAEEEKKAALETEFGTIYYPAKWEDEFITDQEKKDDILTVSFSTKKEKKEYKLFTVTIAGEEGDSVGTITDKNGTKRNVFIEMMDLEDVNAKEEVQNELYAMQESINSIIDYMQ